MSNAWPQSDPILIRDNVAKVLGITVAELEVLAAKLDSVQALDQFPVLLHTQREVKIPAVVDGEVVEPVPHVTELSQDEQQRAEPERVEGSTPRVERPVRRRIEGLRQRVDPQTPRLRAQMPTTRSPRRANSTVASEQRGPSSGPRIATRVFERTPDPST